MNSDEWKAAIQADALESEATRRTIIAAYESMRSVDLRRLLLLDYCCAQRDCMLLHAWRSPQGVLFYQRPFKLSPSRNLADSSESGRRARNAQRGRWPANAGVLTADAGPRLQCDHVKVERLDPTILAADLAEAIPGRPTHRKF